MAGALIGIAGAIGALGGVLINLGLRASYQGASHSATAAFVVFTLFYVVAARPDEGALPPMTTDAGNAVAPRAGAAMPPPSGRASPRTAPTAGSSAR